MKSTTPLHADHALDQLAGQFVHWRQTRTHPYGRIPQPLWDQAVALTATVPPSRVAQTVTGAVGATSKNRWDAVTRRLRWRTHRPGLCGSAPGPRWPPSPPTIQIELSRTDGTRLGIHAPASTLPLAAVVRAFVEGRSCCN